MCFAVFDRRVLSRGRRYGGERGICSLQSGVQLSGGRNALRYKWMAMGGRGKKEGANVGCKELYKSEWGVGRRGRYRKYFWDAP